MHPCMCHACIRAYAMHASVHVPCMHPCRCQHAILPCMCHTCIRACATHASVQVPACHSSVHVPCMHPCSAMHASVHVPRIHPCICAPAISCMSLHARTCGRACFMGATAHVCLCAICVRVHAYDHAISARIFVVHGNIHTVVPRSSGIVSNSIIVAA